MRLIKSSIQVLNQASGQEGIYKHIENCGRISYQSYNHITSDSYKRFYKMLLERKHWAVFEHATIYLIIPNISDYKDFFIHNQYSKVNVYNDKLYVTTNLRTILENSLDDVIYKYLSDPTEYHEERITIKMICSIGIGREFFRHRLFSMIQESTRYCSYSAEKFNNEITFIMPFWVNLPEGRYVFWEGDWMEYPIDKIPSKVIKHHVDDSIDAFLGYCTTSELEYKSLINIGLKAQEAREILPLCTKSELAMTGFVSEWIRFLKLRSPMMGAIGVHPDAAYLADLIYKELVNRNYINE